MIVDIPWRRACRRNRQRRAASLRSLTKAASGDSDVLLGAVMTRI